MHLVPADDALRQRALHLPSREPARPGRELFLSWLALVATLGASGMAARELGTALVEAWGRQDRASVAGLVVLCLVFTFLVYGGLVYQATRLAYFHRLRRHRPTAAAQLEALYEGPAPTLTVLVPSYREEPRVVMQTLLSAALQDYPHKRVVLLIDDPPSARTAEEREGLAAARALAGRVLRRLSGPARRNQAALADFLAREQQPGGVDARQEAATLARLYRQAAAWCEEQARAEDASSHTDTFFVAHVLGSLRSDHLARAAALEAAPPGVALLRREYQRLAALFSADVSCFERKRYVNLSHEPNKAMNLNSYLGLMGQRLRERVRADGCHLEPAEANAPADLTVPATDFVITLDADSLVAPSYALKLVHLMQAPGNERLAVVQTPYSAIPGAPGTLERVAGATTDIQYIIHQGFSAFGATFWVGANALLRRTALLDIAEQDSERGFPVQRFIQDRTVIEDTESTVDLVARGWRLHNHPERLAYSATPPDFGSLLIQRRRWANGGLIILPKLLRYIAGGGARLGEGFMRVHYLVSISAVNVGLLIVLAVPFSEGVESFWMPFTALPYYAMYYRDLRLLGYRRADLLRVYALNLLLIPVNLGGVAKSLQQAWTKAKIPFARTPKVEGRTAAAPFYLLAEYGLVAGWLVTASIDVGTGHFTHAAFAGLNAVMLGYGIVAFIGVRESGEDLRVGLPWLARALGPARLPEPRAVPALAAGALVERVPAGDEGPRRGRAGLPAVGA